MMKILQSYSLLGFTLLLVVNYRVNGSNDHQIVAQTTTPDVANSFVEFLKAYPKVETYLVENVASDDINENMHKAQELLQAELSETPSGKSGLIEALQRFLSLAEVHDEQSCNFNRYITLYYNYLASRSGPGQRQASLRVARITDQFALKHAQLCADFYGAKVKSNYQQMSASGQLGSIEVVLDSALEAATGPNMVEDLVRHFHQQSAPVLGANDGEMIYTILAKQSAQSDADDVLNLFTSCEYTLERDNEEEQSEIEVVTIDKAKQEALERLLDRHIMQPCKSLISNLRDSIEPASFDVLYHPKRQEDFFYIVWGRYKLCDTLTSEVKNKLLNSLVEIACERSYRPSITT